LQHGALCCNPAVLELGSTHRVWPARVCCKVRASSDQILTVWSDDIVANIVWSGDVTTCSTCDLCACETHIDPKPRRPVACAVRICRVRYAVCGMPCVVCRVRYAVCGMPCAMHPEIARIAVAGQASAGDCYCPFYAAWRIAACGRVVCCLVHTVVCMLHAALIAVVVACCKRWNYGPT
jgi:hypothetical protein